MPTVSCEICGKSFYASPSHVKANWGKYCSIPCRTVGMTGEENPRWLGGAGEQACRRCGAIFRIKPSAIKNGKAKWYCSPECRIADLQRECQCKQCGKVFSIPRSRSAKGGGVYCSKACYEVNVAPKPHRVC